MIIKSLWRLSCSRPYRGSLAQYSRELAQHSTLTWLLNGFCHTSDCLLRTCDRPVFILADHMESFSEDTGLPSIGTLIY
ncbi:hypothetical protein P886_2820 [Alteromonadaceae bacterium 2753L.S.0a.02]|nr:hypothetical protein P886_2820 [Alteromonadaceae bacterium 2753L.S.0a.02]